MSRQVIFKTLWLVSERDVAARRQNFSSGKTLLLGPNATGKSRITKNLFWVFGCEPAYWYQGNWDPDTIAALEFEYHDQPFLVIRSGKRLALFRGGETLMFASDNMSSWVSHIAQFFGYQLQLQRPHSTNYAQAGLDYLTLPFYMDQDGSWGADWDTYTSLGQFSKWKSEVFEAFIGLWPNEYFAAKRRKDEVAGRANQKRKDKEAQRLAFRSVRDVLPRQLPALDLATFRRELTDLGRKALETQREQVRVRSALLVSVNQREKLRADLEIARAAQRELVADIAYFSELPGGPVECPTCGTLHEKSFHSRLALSQDVESISELVAELSRKVTTAHEDESRLRGDLKRIGKSLADMEGTVQERKSRLRLDEVLAAHSKKTLDVAFRRVNEELDEALGRLETEERALAAKVKQFRDRVRQKTISDYFANQVASLSSALNVPAQEQLKKPKAGARAQAGGSGAPRSMLAIHLAMLRANVEYGDSPRFPFVVDTPQQSGQDPQNLKRMIEVLGQSAGSDHQVILAVEALPQDVDTRGFDVVQFSPATVALTRHTYNEVIGKLHRPLNVMREAIKAKLEAAPETG